MKPTAVKAAFTDLSSVLFQTEVSTLRSVVEVNRCVGAQEIQLSRQWVVTKTQPLTTPSAPLTCLPTSLLPPLPQQPQNSLGGPFAWAPLHCLETFNLQEMGILHI